MKVACIQLSTGNNLQLNYSKTIFYTNNSIKNKADLIITPEATSLILDNKKDIQKKIYTMSNDPLINYIKVLSKKHKKWILIGSLFIKVKKTIRNRSVMINPDGKIEAFYDKINMFDVSLGNKEKYQESKTFKSGKKIKTVNLPWGKLGMTICYDLRFPEIYRKLSEKNLKFITVPSAFTKTTGKKHWLVLLRARAIENFCYIFAPNQTGKNTKSRTTFGHSVIISPDGKILNIKKSGVGIIYANIDLEAPTRLRKMIPSLKLKKIKS